MSINDGSVTDLQFSWYRPRWLPPSRDTQHRIGTLAELVTATTTEALSHSAAVEEEPRSFRLAVESSRHALAALEDKGYCMNAAPSGTDWWQAVRAKASASSASSGNEEAMSAGPPPAHDYNRLFHLTE